MNIRKIVSICLLLSLTLLLPGCGHKEGEHITAGFAAAEASDYPTALSCFEEAIVAGEDLELAYRGQGIAYLGLADYDAALASFEKALDNAGIFAGDLERDINFYMATAYAKKNENAKAIELLQAIADSDDENADAYYLLGSLYIREGDYNNSIYNYEKAMACADNPQAMKIEVYKELSANGKEDKGREYLNQLLSDGKDLSDYQQGELYYYLGNYDEARTHLELARQSDDKNKSQIIYLLGATYEALGDMNYASVVYQGYLENHPDDVLVMNQYGVCKLEAGNASEAIQIFEDALNKQDTSMTQTLRFNQIVGYEKTGDFAKAKELMEAYMAAYPDDAEAAREATFLETR
ncbi:MAG: tetratricopeptide repeat protein [Lachnospiraceae bacterium]|nr:tetratricopeptide repeat protein [Lachnospiraceae bacterium]